MSFVQVKARSGTSGLPSVDRTPFYGARVPDEVKLMAKTMKGLDYAVIKKTLKLVATNVEEGSLKDGVLLETVAGTKISEETMRIIFLGLLKLARLGLRQPNLKAEAFREDLQQLKFPPELCTEMSSIVFGKKRSRIENGLRDNAVSLPKLDSLKWRVDVTISNSTLNRVLEPSVLMEMTMTNGTVKTFEIPVAKFHELRYSVAFVIKEMEDLEKRNILKT